MMTSMSQKGACIRSQYKYRAIQAIEEIILLLSKQERGGFCSCSRWGVGMFGLEGPKRRDIPASIPCRHTKPPSKHVKAGG